MPGREFSWHRPPACESTTQTRGLCHSYHLPALTERRYNTFHRPFRLRVACSRASGVALNPFPYVKVIDAIRAGDLPGAWPGLC